MMVWGEEGRADGDGGGKRWMKRMRLKRQQQQLHKNLRQRFWCLDYGSSLHV